MTVPVIRFNPLTLLGFGVSAIGSGRLPEVTPAIPDVSSTLAAPAPCDSSHHVGLLDLERSPEEDVTRRLLQRASFWNFRKISLTRPEDLQSDSFEQMLYTAALGDVFAAAGSDKAGSAALEKVLRGMGCDSEILAFARDYVKERARSVAGRIDLKTRESRRRLAVEFLDMALHARQEVGVSLFLARRLADVAGRDWKGLVQDHREMKTPYEKELIRFLQDEGGTVPFDRFFEHAMFNPEAGTYTGTTAERLIAPDPSLAPESFFTTASTDPILADAICSFSRKSWEALGLPIRFDLVEMGAGMGSLAEGVLSRLERMPEGDPFSKSVRYTIVEKSPALARLQTERLARFGPKARVLCRSAVFGPLPAVPAGVLFSNELVDMFPPRKIVNVGGSLFEAYVTHRGGLIQEINGPMREDTAKFLAERAIRLRPGETFYIQPDIDRWVTALASLERGWVATIDYGERREELRRTRHEFGRSMFRGYLRSDDPKYGLGLVSVQSYRNSPTGVARPKDMTVDVDFTTLEEAVRLSGVFQSPEFLTQREFSLRYAGERPKIGHFDNCRVMLLPKNV
ncbi:MAG TPA: SAM-dependent methyltransferase [bacterium]|nr:SAM-dependent methyltransferase [bacterium]